MNNRTVAQRFAELQLDKGQSFKGSNLFVEGDTIYSYGYHFPIAHKTGKEYNGHKIVIFNDSSYSNSTSKHQSYVRGALHDFSLVHTKDIKRVIEQGMTQALRRMIKEELDKKIENLQAKEQRARKAYIKELYREDIAAIQQEKEVLRFV